MKNMQISLIITVFNEQNTILQFIESVFNQSRLPDEFIIADGGSTDNTSSVISNFQFPISNKKIKFKFIVKKGNRSVGRNEAIKNARGNVILCSDAGCILDKNWVKNIIEPFNNPETDVVAGYYKGKPKSIFEKCLIPYVLVMKDKINSNNFLPASRSMAFRKKIWGKVGGFPEQFNNNEDYVFANKLTEIGAKIIFAKDAVVSWIPRKNYKESFIMFFQFALGDAESRIWRTSVLLLFARYILGLYFIFLSLLYKSFLPICILLVVFVIYILLSVKKIYKYVKDRQAIKIIPLLQLTADMSVLSGSVLGLIKVIKRFSYFSYLKQNNFLFFIIAVYVGVLLLTLRWGIPNQNHPFPYHMDEWHQLQAVRATFAYGTPNVPGAANGTLFHFLLSGFYLIPFTILNIINPFVIKIDDFFMRERIFELLRINTMIFGLASMFMLWETAKKICGNPKVALLLFVFTPAWLLLSGYFKYDIALVFWTILSVYFTISYLTRPSGKNFIFASIPTGIAIAVKISALPLFLIYMLSFLFVKHKEKDFLYLLEGIASAIFCAVIFGIPDTIFGKGNIYSYLYDNIIYTPSTASNFNLANPLGYLFFRHYPVVFGYGLLCLLIISALLLMYLVQKNKFRKAYTYKFEIFLFLSFLLFIISLLPLKIFAGANRSLVLLPFAVLFISKVYMRYTQKFKLIATFLFLIIVFSQVFQSLAWVYIKLNLSPQESASSWIKENINRGSTIGLENIPIYQMLPDILQKEFYYSQYKVNSQNMFYYRVVDSKTLELPQVVVMTNSEIETQVLKQSEKAKLLRRLKKESYKKIAEFNPNLSFYKYFGNAEDFYLSGLLVASPSDIVVYEKY